MLTTQWSGRAVTRARAIVATWLPAPCGQCGKEVKPGSRWVVGHKVARWERPDLMWEPSNWRPEHRACSDATGQAAVIAKAKADALREAGSSPDGDLRQSPPLPFSPSGGQEEPLEVHDDLRWDPEALGRYEWLQPLLDIPENAAPPLAMTRPPADAVGSYGADAIEWIETTERKTLRWWQRLAVVRQLEHREDGSLCHREVVESGPRRIGKSVRIRGMALWRLEHGPDLFGETQLVVHTGSDVAICRQIQKAAWRWAETVAGWRVSRANGKEAMTTPEDDEWLIRAQSAVYGYDTCYGVVDEGWDVKPDTVSEGIEPAMLERSSPQLHLTSTAHRRATSLMRTRLSEALTIPDPDTLLLLWAAPPGADPALESTWRAASPHWSEDRRRLIASKYEKALAGEVDPAADDPNPMEGFLAQYCNIWRLRARGNLRGEAVVSQTDWATLLAAPPLIKPDAAAIESWFSEGTTLVLAWRIGEQVVVSASDHTDLASAAATLKESGFKGTATVGKSLATDPALKGIRRKPGEGRTGPAVHELARMLAEDGVAHDGGDHLTGQVLAVRTQPGADGPRMVSKERADAVKAAVWAIRAARVSIRGNNRLILPRSA